METNLNRNRDFKSERDFAEFIKELGGDAYLVGGAVRDQFLSSCVPATERDRDYMVTGIAPCAIPFEKIVGTSFPVYIVNIENTACEVALARTERKINTNAAVTTKNAHTAFTVTSNPHITVKEDLKRRDLSMNAMAIHILSQVLVDPYNGRQDIKNRLLRHTSLAFTEDPLRIFRVARFASQFNFRVAEETEDLMNSISSSNSLNTLNPLQHGDLNYIPGERVWKETEKALASRYPHRFFEVLKEIDALSDFFPEILALDVPDKHDGTAFKHTMRLMKGAATISATISTTSTTQTSISAVEQFSLLTHDLGKALTPPSKHPSHHGHDKLAHAPITNLCKRLKVPNKYRDPALTFAAEHMRAKVATEMRDGKFLRWVLNLSSNSNKNENPNENRNPDSDIVMILKLSYLDSALKDNCDFLKNRKHFRTLAVLIDLALHAINSVHARDLLKEKKGEGKKYSPGPKLGEALFQRRVSEYRQLKRVNKEILDAW